MINRLEKLKELKNIRESGQFPGIPTFHKYTRLGDYMPAIIKGVMYLITAHSGIGKSQFWKDFFLFMPIKVMKKFPEYNIKLKFIIFLLEESKEEFIDSIISGLLYREKGLEVDPLELNSMKKTPVSKKVLKAVEEIYPLVEEVLSMCELYDTIYNPTGMYLAVKNYAINNGIFVYEDRVFKKKDEDGEPTEEIVKVFKEYIPNNPNEYVFVISDHISLIEEEKDGLTGKMLDLRESMEKWSFHYCRKQISKNLNYIPVNIQQQVQSSDVQQFTFKGVSIIDKLKPSSGNLADCKTTFRDHLVVMGLFNPGKHDIENYNGYNIKELNKNYRSLLILKNRIGRDGLEAPLYFKGSSNFFKELPKEITPEIYNKIKNKTY